MSQKEREQLTNPEIGLIKVILDQAQRKSVNEGVANIGTIATAALNQNRNLLIESLASCIKFADDSLKLKSRK